MKNETRALSTERLKQLSISHGLDGGGYEYDRPEDCLYNLQSLGMVAIWEAPDFDYLGIEGPGSRRDEHDYVFAFSQGSFENWPEIAGHIEEHEDETTYVLAETGTFNEYDRDCDCRGKRNATEPGGWEFTGNASDDPHPDCTKCEGDGYFVHEGGSYALYKSVKGPITEYDSDEYDSTEIRKRAVERLISAHRWARTQHTTSEELNAARRESYDVVVDDYDRGWIDAIDEHLRVETWSLISWAHRFEGRVYFDFMHCSAALASAGVNWNDARVESAHVWRLGAQNGDPDSAVKLFGAWRHG